MRISIATFLLLSMPIFAFSQELYDVNTVQRIDITFDQPNWDALMDAEKAGNEDYILAAEVKINGTAYDSVGVKYKGNSTYKANQVKNGLHIELDTYKDHEHQGYTDIKLSNGYKDPSFVREVLSYAIIRQYMDAPLSNYANVHINGELIGLYSNSESVSKKFVNKRFGSKNNTFVKCNPVDGAGPQSSNLPDLVYLGEDSTEYYAGYELKSDAGWQHLIDLCRTLENDVEEIESVLDVDRALWMIALDNVLVNLDSYIGQFSQNYYLYQSDAGQFLPVIWDLNESLGVFSSTGSGNLSSTAQKQQMSHLLHENDDDFPLVKQLLSIPTYKKRYLAHVKTILQENFENGEYLELAQLFHDVADESVQNDPNGFFTYNQFQTNLNSDVTSGSGPMGSRAPGVTNLMNGRSEYLLGLPDFTATQPSIDNVTASNPTPQLLEEITITATISDGETAVLGYRTATQAPFQKIQMLDDGLHNDGAANDGVFGAAITISSQETQYYIYAENEVIGKFSPARAEYEYHDISAITVVGDVVINEFMASNDVTASDQDGDFDDWIELYNNSDVEVDLSGYFLSDKTDEVDKWAFPEGTVIRANDYLVIWADEDLDQEGLHADFKLSGGGEAVVLSDPDTVLVDNIIYDEQETDISYGRFPNGTGDFDFLVPSIGAENTMLVSVAEDLQTAEVNMYPNPVADQLALQSTEAFLSVKVYAANGALLQNNVFNQQQSVKIDASQLPTGLNIVHYVLANGDSGCRKVFRL